MSLLPSIRGPRDVKALDAAALPALAAEIREFLIAAVSRTGGHLGPNLGVVELTIALHRVFDSPRDRILFDVGHQCYVHKLLTGRQDFSTLRRSGGLSGYPSRGESEHDIIENQHASVALAWADGFTKATELLGDDARTVAVVGDGALTGGMAWEALNNIAAAKHRPLVIVVNDNAHSYSPTIGGLANHLATLRLSNGYGLFEDLGLKYLGPVDGHDLTAVEKALRNAKNYGGPVIVHCITEKGRGYPPAQRYVERLHQVKQIDPQTGQPLRPADPDWTNIFGDELLRLGHERGDIVAITAAMPRSTGLEPFARHFPDRAYDVGIAEQHAAASAAAMATAGLHPVVAVYATFFNRCFDQVTMDVALHRCPVTFVLDRAGVTGDDGASHNGMWDLAILQAIPGIRIAAPRDADRLRVLLREAIAVADGPTVLRFPKGTLPNPIPTVERFRGMDILHRDRTGPKIPAADVLIVSLGALAHLCLDVARGLARETVTATVVDPGWVTPPHAALADLAATHPVVVTVEDGLSSAGAGAAITRSIRQPGVIVENFGLPTAFLDHGTRQQTLADAGLTAPAVANRIRLLLSERRLLTPVTYGLL